MRVLDVTFVGEDDGFALASARCLRGSGRCTALLRTTDGTSWHSMAGPRFNVAGVRGCAAPCVSHLRFANDQTGYAFGPHALLMTTDGGRSWVQQKGTGATALESLNGNVIRVFSTAKGCPPACTMQVGTAANGSRRWVTATLPGATLADGVQLARSGSAAYVLLTRNPAAGAGRQTSALYRSRDDGRTWTPLGEPCPQAGGETDSLAVSAGAGQRAAVLCATRQPQRCFVVTSTDAGASWTTRPMTVPAATAGVLTGDPATVLVTAGSGVAFSTDGGRRWSVVPDITGNVTFIGFESTSVGRVVADGGRTIWTTRDAGASWREVALP